MSKAIELQATRSDAEWARRMKDALHLAKRQCTCSEETKENEGQEPGECEVKVCPPCQARGALNAADAALDEQTGARPGA